MLIREFVKLQTWACHEQLNNHLFAFLSFSWFILAKDPLRVKLAVNPSHKLKDWRLMSAFIQVINMLRLSRGVTFSFPTIISPLYPKYSQRGKIFSEVAFWSSIPLLCRAEFRFSNPGKGDRVSICTSVLFSEPINSGCVGGGRLNVTLDVNDFKNDFTQLCSCVPSTVCILEQ